MNDKLDEILGSLAEDLINYDKRMDDAGAPPIRFTHKYNSEAKKQLTAFLDSIVEEVIGRPIDPLDVGALTGPAVKGGNGMYESSAKSLTQSQGAYLMAHNGLIGEQRQRYANMKGEK